MAHWALPKNSSCPRSSCSRGLRRIELAEHVQLRRRREIEQRLELGHEVHLAAALQDVDALLRGDHRVAVEVRGPLLELGEVLDRLQRPLRAEQPLDVHAAQRRRVDPVAELLRPDVADQVRGRVGVAVHVAVEAGHAAAAASRVRRSSVWLNCCCGNGVTSSRKPFDLLRVQNAVEQLEEVHDRDELALRHVAQVGPRGQEDRRRELGQEVRRAGRSPGRTASGRVLPAS